MKKFVYFIPVLIFLLISIFGSRLLASGTLSPKVLVLITALIIGLLVVFRPKTAAPKPVSNLEQKVRGDYAKDAFADNTQLNAKFQSAIKDYNTNCPKAALSKLTKLSSQCRKDEEIYAVSVLTAMCHLSVGKPKDAVREYTRALSLHPTSDLAHSLGSCQQRLGQLNKARDSYEFALDLDESNVEARSSLATSYVADGDYESALEQATLVLERNEKHASALATTAICYGLLNDPVMSKHYTKLAVENGYNEKKITDTISALKKRS